MTVLTGSRPSATVAPAVGDPAPNLSLPDPSGHEVHLADLWAKAPTALVLAFVRHYGCPLCREMIAKFRQAHADFEALGARIVLIGQGTPADAARLVQRERLPFTVLSDRDGSAFAAYGLAEGTPAQLFGGQALRRYLTTLARGFLPGRVIGNHRQLPGTFIVDPSGIVRFSHPATHAADTPDAQTLLAAVRAINAR